jgi:glycosyltransferase involved in cell wall biosynthesis
MPNGINLGGYAPLPDRPGPPVIGFLARLSREKGLEVMVDAFVHLRTVLGHPSARLHLAGAATAENDALIALLQQRLAAVGLTEQVRWQANISREDKITMLRNLTLFSVPAIYPEAFGLYVIEAMASGVPVVQPAAASFPEIVARAGAGVLVAASDEHGPPLHESLAQAWNDLLQQPEKLREMAAGSRRAAEEYYDIGVMRDRFLVLAREILRITAGNCAPTILHHRVPGQPITCHQHAFHYHRPTTHRSHSGGDDSAGRPCGGP